MTQTADVHKWAALIGRAIPDYEHRPQQSAMADAVAHAFAHNEHLMVEAGTGVGKSFAYLAPAVERILEHGERVVVSTHTIALQEQLIAKDIPAIQKAVARPFRAELVKGRSNYLGIRRLAQASRRQKAVFSTQRQLQQLHVIEDWAYQTRDGSLADLEMRPDTDVWGRVRSESNNCMGSRCEHYDNCFFQRARRQMEGAHLLVVNHAMFFADLALRRRHDVSILPNYDFVVLDEAHNVESVVSDHFGLSVSSNQVSHLLRTIFNERTGRGFIGMLDCPQLIQLVVQAERHADTLFDALRRAYPPKRGTVRVDDTSKMQNLLSPALERLADGLKELKEQFQREDDKFELNSLATRCREMSAALDDLLNRRLEDAVYWLETSEGREENTKLTAAPLKVGKLLQESLFEHARSVIMTSATLSVGEGEKGFDYMRDRLGAVESTSLQLDSPFDYVEQMTLHVETALPEPNAPNFISEACRRIEHYVAQTEGRAFVLFTSYYQMNEAAEMLEWFCRDEGYELFVQGRSMPRGKMVERFRQRPRSILLGTDSFWQGVDVPGDALSNVIITKLPFAAPDRPLVEARVKAIEEDGGNGFMDFQVPEAILKLKQGFGRLIRSRRDRGIVVILDKRVKTKFYGRRFLTALPTCRVEYH
ncbi:MAG: DEAD/DEAH box helicase [Phycisphaerales bacterium]|nr:DEAD/DEAH box helicase [Phycisphaerales bacterium]